MLRTLCLTLAAVLLFAPLSFLRAEETPAPAPAPAPAADKDKPAAPDASKPAPAEAEKKDEAGGTKDAAKAAVPAGALEPAVVQGTPPKFPLVSENFDKIEDKYEHAEDAADIESEALADILTAIRASSQDYLLKNVDPAVTYVTMMNKPEECRGKVVKTSGTLRMVNEIPRTGKPPIAGAATYWRGQVSVGTTKITSFICLEPLPKDVAIGRGVNIVGVFMKRWVYSNNAPGEKGTWTPLIICRRIERVTEYDQVATGAMNSWLGIGIFVVVGGGLLVFFILRGSKSRYANKFSRMKAERGNNASRNFPRPG